MASPCCTYYTAVDLSTHAFEPLAKQNKLYVANLAPALTVVTPPVQLASSLADADAPFAYLRPHGRLAAWLRDVEAWVLDACLANKGAWFRKDVDDDALRHNFKSFFRETGEFKVRTSAGGDVAVFAEDGQPAGAEEAVEGRHVRCVLELSRVCFGRQEFGAMWRLVQARLVDVPPCLIHDDDDDEAADAEDAGAQDVHVGEEPEEPLDADEQEFV